MINQVKFQFIIFFLSLSMLTFAQRGTRVGYIDMDFILDNVDE